MSKLAKLHVNYYEFLDVALVPSEGDVIIVHPIMLAAFSDFLDTLLLDQPRPQDHSVIFLPDFTFSEVNKFLEDILDKALPESTLCKLLLSDNKFENSKENLDNNDKNVTPLSIEMIIGNPKNQNEEASSNDSLIKSDNFVNKSDIQDEIKCPYCEKVFTTRKRMHCHLSLAHESRKEYLDFMKKQEDNNWICKLCVQIFTRSEQCSDHLLSVHELGTIFDCKVCKKQVIGKVNIRAHMITHDKLFSCDVCGKGFSTKHELKTHFLKVHSSAEEQSQARKHACSKCPKRFYTGNLLYRHEFVHSEIDNFSCKICPHSSKTADAIRLHTNQIHLGKLPTQATIDKHNANTRKMRIEKRRKNGGFLRIGEEKVRFNEYMRKWSQKKKLEKVSNQTMNHAPKE